MHPTTRYPRILITVLILFNGVHTPTQTPGKRTASTKCGKDFFFLSFFFPFFLFLLISFLLIGSCRQTQKLLNHSRNFVKNEECFIKYLMTHVLWYNPLTTKWTRILRKFARSATNRIIEKNILVMISGVLKMISNSKDEGRKLSKWIRQQRKSFSFLCHFFCRFPLELVKSFSVSKLY
jgi:hypothetical protein